MLCTVTLNHLLLDGSHSQKIDLYACIKVIAKSYLQRELSDTVLTGKFLALPHMFVYFHDFSTFTLYYLRHHAFDI